MTDWPETDALLERFRAWLDQVREESQDAGNEPVAARVGRRGGRCRRSRGERALGSSTWFANSRPCGTKSNCRRRAARGLEEQTAAAIAAMEEAGRQFRAVAPQEAEAARRAALPLIESLADLDEALGRAQAVVESARRAARHKSQAGFSRQLADLDAAQPAWKRWLCRSWHAGVRDLCQADAEDRKRIVDALAEGYAMVRKRLAAGDGQRRPVPHGQPRPAGRSARHDRGRGGRRRRPCPGHGG